MAEPAVGADPTAFPERGARRADLDRVVTAFLVEEAAALDEARYDDWLDLLEPDFLYRVPVPLLREDPALPRHSATAVLFEATKRTLRLKLGRVDLRHAWSDRPAATTRHFLGGVRVFAVPGADTVRVDANLLVTANRGVEHSALVTASRQDVLVPRGGGDYRVRARRVLLDVEVPTVEQLSIIF
ncbi:aromatic-ring-hydroxylating dioxygenase subunit beta [Saccharothrix obliqua]|uniref:aromatic-ring-hydroxylating dioxygenase subunit beta n=1 Tax=Saccharothrix obliqua TaxID=2861747 RepID=UPI001C5EA7D8|nr:aromatic-ring-hydroxylating dioxygenase subunit beta [Saccharothrix obliqua]MBW4718800.1 hypothetical protein [Saccharothrix obliqua]